MGKERGALEELEETKFVSSFLRDWIYSSAHVYADVTLPSVRPSGILTWFSSMPSPVTLAVIASTRTSDQLAVSAGQHARFFATPSTG